MKILVTGGEGLLGGTFKSHSQNEVVSFGRLQLDITDYTSVRNTLSVQDPDVVIHAAAMTNVEACEQNVASAMHVNVYGTLNIALVCRELCLKLVFISSTGIYSDCLLTAHDEMSQVHAQSVHHKSKVLGELIVSDLWRRRNCRPHSL